MFGILKSKKSVISIIGVLILIFFGIWYLIKTTSGNVKVSCRDDVKICSDGTSVVRIPPKCEFAQCPERKGEVVDKNNLKTYRNEYYNVELTYSATKDYPRSHDEPDGYPNGFFNISAEGSFNVGIDDYVKPDDYTIRKYFGSNPVITSLTVDGQEARMVNLSTPPDNSKDDTAWIIIKYPKPIPSTNKEESWHFLAIYTTRLFANDIVPTIKFLNR